jgi:hypothetical protein
MEKQKFTRREIEVPAGLIAEVSVILLGADIAPHITGADEDEGTVTLEVEYDREQREAINDVDEAIEDYNDDEGEDDDEEDGD